MLIQEVNFHTNTRGGLRGKGGWVNSQASSSPCETKKEAFYSLIEALTRPAAWAMYLRNPNMSSHELEMAHIHAVVGSTEGRSTEDVMRLRVVRSNDLGVVRYVASRYTRALASYGMDLDAITEAMCSGMKPSKIVFMNPGFSGSVLRRMRCLQNSK
jgi:hypothetical protein